MLRKLSRLLCVLCTLALLTTAAYAADRRVPSARFSSAGTEASYTQEASDEEAPLPPKYDPENARRNIYIVFGSVIVVVAVTAVVVRRHLDY